LRLCPGTAFSPPSASPPVLVSWIKDAVPSKAQEGAKAHIMFRADSDQLESYPHALTARHPALLIEQLRNKVFADIALP
jgi:hypothetical protein